MRKRIPITSGHRQQGYTLIAMLFGLALVAASLATYARFEARKAAISRADAAGNVAAQFATGLRGYIAMLQANPSMPAGGPRAGVNWLKSPSCGGEAGNPSQGFVPCSFTGGIYGPLYDTRLIKITGTGPDAGFVEARTYFQVPADNGDPTSRILAAERVVQGALAAQDNSNGVFFSAHANVIRTYDPTTPGPVVPTSWHGAVLMIATNAPSNDIWLRTDGTNQMLANLNMGGMSIGNARDGRFSGDVRISNRLQVDQGATIMGPSDLRGGVVTNEIALTSIGKFATEGIYDSQVMAGLSEYTVPKPDCSLAGNNPGIYVAVQGTGTPNWDGADRADALYEARADVTDLGTAWRIQPIVRGTKFDFDFDAASGELVVNRSPSQTTPEDMRLLVMTRCR